MPGAQPRHSGGQGEAGQEEKAALLRTHGEPQGLQEDQGGKQCCPILFTIFRPNWPKTVGPLVKHTVFISVKNLYET
jgi:hypothetical protein